MAGPVIYHGTPMTPRAALLDVMDGRAGCVSFYRPDDVDAIEHVCSKIMYDNGAFSYWQKALRSGSEWAQSRDWFDFYAWLEPRLTEGRWAVIPDSPGAPSQINDGLLNDWPFGQWGSPLFHMNGNIERLLRLCGKYDRVCLGWVGRFDEELGAIAKDERAVGCDAYHRRMDEIDAAFGNRWPVIHMMRGVAVARDYPFRKRGQHKFGPKRMEARQPDGRADRQTLEGAK